MHTLRKSIMSSLAAAAIGVLFSAVASANTGWLSSYNYTFFSADTVYRLNGTPFNDPASTLGTPVGNFDGANLGTYDWLTPGNLFLNAEISAWADGGDSYQNFSLWYRVYAGTGAGSGAFTQVSAPTLSNYTGNNWRGFATGVNLEQIAQNSGSMGTFTVQTYLSRRHTWTGGGTYTTFLTTAGDTGGATPTGNYFTATFVATPEPSTYVMAAFAAVCCGWQGLRRRRGSSAGR